MTTEDADLQVDWAADMRATLDRWDRARGKGGYPTAMERYAMRRVLAENAQLQAAFEHARTTAQLIAGLMRQVRRLEDEG